MCSQTYKRENEYTSTHYAQHTVTITDLSYRFANRPLQFFLPSLNSVCRNLPEHLPLPKTIEVFKAVVVSILLLTSVRYPAKYYKCTPLNKYDNASTVLYLLSICRKQNLPNQNTDILRVIIEIFYHPTGKLRPYRLLLNIKFNEVKPKRFQNLQFYLTLGLWNLSAKDICI